MSRPSTAVRRIQLQRRAAGSAPARNGFRAFFRRVKAGEKPGFLRFRAKSRFHSADFRVGDVLDCGDGRLRLACMPALVKIRWHCELPARASHAIVSRSDGKRYATLRFKIPVLAGPIFIWGQFRGFSSRRDFASTAPGFSTPSRSGPTSPVPAARGLPRRLTCSRSCPSP